MASACSTTPAHAHGHGHSIHTIDGKVNVNVDIEVNANADVSLSLFQTDNRNHEHDNDEVSHERHINIHTTSTPRAGTVTVTGDCGDQVTGSESINCSLANSHGRCNSNIGQLQGDHECECANESRLPEQTASAIAPLSTQTSTDCMGTTSTSTRTGSTIIIDNDKENGAISISTCMNTDNAMNIDNDIDCHSRARQEATATSTSTAATNMPANANPINTGIDINTNTDTSSPSRPGTRTRTSPAKSRHRVRLLTTQDNHNLHRSVSSSSSDDTNLNDNVVQTTTRSNATDHAITATTTATATANYSFNISNRISATSYQANDPSEDRYASLTNVLLQESNANTSESNQEDLESNQHQAQAQLGPIRMSLFAVLDGHGGPAVAEYASRKLLPLLVQRISDTLDCDVVQPGLFQVNGQTVSVPLRVDGRNTCTRTRTRTRACSGDGLDSDVDISDSEEEDSDEEEDWYKAPDILPSRTDPCSLSSSSQSQSQSPSRGFTIGTHTIQERNAITQAIQESYLQFDEEWMNAISRKGKRQTFLVHNGKWNSGACCLVNVVLQRMDMNMNMSANANADDGSAMGMNMGMNMGGEEHEAILYSSHTGDCRAVLLSGDSTSGADADGEAISDDLSFHNSSSDSDDDDEDDNAGDGDESENYVPLNRMLFQRIKGGKRPLLNPFNTNQRFQRRRMWNQCDVGGGSGNSLMDLEQADSPARIESLRQQHHHMQGSEDGNDDGIGNGKGNGLHSHSISNVMIRMCSRSPSPMEFPPQPTPMPKLLHATTLTEDHTPYNAREASLVRERCSYAPRAIAASTNGGIKRVAGSLSVTRALGDAYLKTPMLSFEPYKAHAPYISAMPEVSSRILTGDDRILILASDGVWERVDGDKMLQWVGDYYRKRKGGSGSSSGRSSPSGSVESYRSGARPTLSRRMRMLPTRKSLSTVEQEAVNARILNMTNVSDMVVAKVLNRVRRKYKMANLSSLMDLPKGTSRRMKHDDITTLVVDLEGFTIM
jgi:serine/threonine protein phosphatase PrpC